MSITKISAATAGIAATVATFALVMGGATQAANGTHANSTSVVADGHWGTPTPSPTPAVNDDGHWG